MDTFSKPTYEQIAAENAKLHAAAWRRAEVRELVKAAPPCPDWFEPVKEVWQSSTTDVAMTALQMAIHAQRGTVKPGDSVRWSAPGDVAIPERVSVVTAADIAEVARIADLWDQSRRAWQAYESRQKIAKHAQWPWAWARAVMEAERVGLDDGADVARQGGAG